MMPHLGSLWVRAPSTQLTRVTGPGLPSRSCPQFLIQLLEHLARAALVKVIDRNGHLCVSPSLIN